MRGFSSKVATSAFNCVTFSPASLLQLPITLQLRQQAMASWLRPGGKAAQLLCRHARSLPTRRSTLVTLPPDQIPRTIRRWASHHSRPGPSIHPPGWLPSVSGTGSIRHRMNALHPTRSFHKTPPRRDILFVSVPAFKAFLLSVTRVTLVVLPFWWRSVHSARDQYVTTLTRSNSQMETLQALSEGWQDAVATTRKMIRDLDIRLQSSSCSCL